MDRLILMLESDEDDRYITLEYLKNIEGLGIKMVLTSNEVFSYLQACRTGDERLPSLLLLNYDSSPDNAVEILQGLKKERKFSHIPVVILSGTVIPGIVRECYALGACSFIQKPALVSEIEIKIQSFLDYWFKAVELPEGTYKK